MASFKTVLVACLATGSAPASAASPWLALGAQHPECTCRVKGANVALGSQICMATASGQRMAECVMEQNVTSWRATGQLCPEARLAPNMSP